MERMYSLHVCRAVEPTHYIIIIRITIIVNCHLLFEMVQMCSDPILLKKLQYKTKTTIQVAVESSVVILIQIRMNVLVSCFYSDQAPQDPGKDFRGLVEGQVKRHAVAALDRRPEAGGAGGAGRAETSSAAVSHSSTRRG